MKGKKFILLLAGILWLSVSPVYAEGFSEESAEEEFMQIGEEFYAENSAGTEEFQEEIPMESMQEEPVLSEQENISSPEFSTSEDSIPVDEEHFPDAIFREMILEKYDSDRDGCLTKKERQAVTQIMMYHKKAESLQGLQYFPRLEYLTCQDSLIRELNMSENPQLKGLNVGYNPYLERVDVSQNKELETVYGYEGGKWEYLDLRDCTKLEILGLGKIEKVDLRNNTSLWQLYGEIDEAPAFFECPILRDVRIRGNFPEIDLSESQAMQYLDIENNEVISSIDVSELPNLINLSVKGCRNLTGLDIGKNRKLYGLVAADSGLKRLTARKTTRLKQLHLANCNFETLDLSCFPNLEYLDCSGNPLTSLDLSACPRVNRIYCKNTDINKLDLSMLFSIEEYSVDEECQTLFIKEPKLLGAELKGTNQVTVTWKPVVGAHGYGVPGYKVYRRNMEGNWEPVKGGKLTESSYTQRVVPGRSYTYKVIAYRWNQLTDEVLESTGSEEGVSTKTLLSTPKLQSAVRIGRNQVEVRWKAVKGATQYRVYRRRVGGTVWRNMGDTVKTTFTDEKVPTGTNYCYTVKAYNENKSPTMISWYQKGGIEAIPLI